MAGRSLADATIEGKAEVKRAFDHIAEQAADAQTVATKLAAIGVDAARAAAPTRTGELVSSIASEVGTNEADISSEVGHAQFVEFGTVHMPGVRFMGAGYGAMLDQAQTISEAWMSGVLDAADRMA